MSTPQPSSSGSGRADGAGVRPGQPSPAAGGPSRHAADPAGPQPLFAPWRFSYIEGLSEAETREARAASESPPASSSAARAEPAPAGASFFTDYWHHPQRDDENLVIVRDEQGMILLNRYPYAGGHLLVALGLPRQRLLDYSPQQRAHLWSLVDHAAELMERALNPQGINIGVNQGRAAGAGVPGHLHVHLVPRWSGDVNFMTVAGNVRVIPASLETMLARYRAALPAAPGRPTRPPAPGH